MNWYKQSQPMLPEEERGPAFQVGKNISDADFYLRSKGSIESLGEVFKEPGDMSAPIGVKVLHTDKFDPKFMYYYFMNLKNQGVWKKLGRGVIRSQHITISDVKEILNMITT